MKDKRYSINYEFCGYHAPRHVLRFCGVFVGSFRSKGKALKEAKAHNLQRFDPSPLTPQQDIIDDVCNELVREEERIAAFELNEEA